MEIAASALAAATDHTHTEGDSADSASDGMAI